MEFSVTSPSILDCIYLSFCCVHCFVVMLDYRVSWTFRIREPRIRGSGVHLLYSNCFLFYETGECKDY